MLVAEASNASFSSPPRQVFFFLLPLKQLIPVHKRSQELRKETSSLSFSPFPTMQSQKDSGSRTLSGRNRH